MQGALAPTAALLSGQTVGEAQAAFTPTLRTLLRRWGFQGHLELKPGGLLLYFVDLKATPDHYDAMMQRIPMVVNAALTPG